ncbi:heavy-metal-associated domain-containing protein [Planosporangium sp. 12N6]|uniref:heavy-metal-associated domain-containing protein n=1 Tax=Planosporangium spinosum TaxID=3402278 RepID=UPI003CF7EC8B
MPVTTHLVNGMTSPDCADHVRAEVGRLPGVSRVQADAATGRVTVTSVSPIDAGAVHAAVQRAGFVLGEPARSRSGSWWPFVRHYLEMMVSMVVGMVVFGAAVNVALSLLGVPDLFDGTEVSSLVMATTMTLGMSLWMRYRKHGWASIAEMGAAMYVPFLVLFVPYWAGLLSGHGVMMWGHVLMLPLMAVAMMWRRDEYTGHHGHAH